MADMQGGNFVHDNMEIPRSNMVMPMFSLQGRTAIVAGAGAGIGLAVAQGLAEAGANVAIWYNSNKKALEEAASIEKTYGVKCRAYQVNVTSAEGVESAINDIVAEFNGRLDIFVANSGIAWEDGAFIDGPVDRARKVMAVNVEGVMWCAKSAGAHFRRQKQEGTTTTGRPLDNFIAGSFIATGSMSGSIVNIPQLQAVYNGSKAAVIHFVKSLAVEWVGFARANIVSPGYIATEITDFASPETKNHWRNKIPFGREGNVKELKGAYLYLASDASSYTSGLNMVVDGGYELI